MEAAAAAAAPCGWQEYPVTEDKHPGCLSPQRYLYGYTVDKCLKFSVPSEVSATLWIARVTEDKHPGCLSPQRYLYGYTVDKCLQFSVPSEVSATVWIARVTEDKHPSSLSPTDGLYIRGMRCPRPPVLCPHRGLYSRVCCVPTEISIHGYAVSPPRSLFTGMLSPSPPVLCPHRDLCPASLVSTSPRPVCVTSRRAPSGSSKI